MIATLAPGSTHPAVIAEPIEAGLIGEKNLLLAVDDIYGIISRFQRVHQLGCVKSATSHVRIPTLDQSAR